MDAIKLCYKLYTKGKNKDSCPLSINVLSHTEDTQENPLLLQLLKKGYVESNLT